MKSFLNIIKADCIKWLTSDKQFITAFSLIFFYMYVIEPMKEYSKILNEPLNITEPFIALIGNGFCILVVVITFMVLMIDFPDISGNATFLLIRTGRIKWYNSQILFAIVSACILLLIYFIFSVIFLIKDAFSANIWSNAIKLIGDVQNEELRIQYPLAVIDLSVINNYSILSALTIGVVLMILHMIFISQLQMTLSICFNKIIGLSGNLMIIGLGLVFWVADTKIKWLFPFANSTIGWHYDELYNKTEFPIAGSFIYMVTINVVIYIFGTKAIKNKALTLLS